MDKLVTKWFSKWSRKAGLTNSAILEALVDLENGLSVADLGKNLFKVRVKREGQGKSSGYRTIVVFRKEKKRYFYMGLLKIREETLATRNCFTSRNLAVIF